MNVSWVAAVVLGGISALGISLSAVSQDADDGSTSVPMNASAPAPGFTPGFADLMTMLIQPRHLRLYYAGARKNWELAAFESQQLNSALRRISQSIPQYRASGSVDEALQAMIVPSIKAVDAAIAAGDSTRFLQAYRDLTAGCNACHIYTEHPFIVIRVPEGNSKNSVFPNEEFRVTDPGR